MMEERNRHPYKNIDWKSCHRITACTHFHCLKQQQLDEAFASGLDLVSITNYYPSRPTYPLKEEKNPYETTTQYGYIKDGVWHHEKISFAGKGKGMENGGESLLFPSLPPDLLEIPNTEHHDFADLHPFFHITAPGSLLASGTPERLKDSFSLASQGYEKGCPLPWKEAFTHILQELITPDGGGIIINHPAESRVRSSLICEMLDFDPRILGMEIYNHCSGDEFAASAETIWDEVLSTGRQCFGFCTLDQPRKKYWGKIVLLTEERTMEACLKAMRNGDFYGKITNDTLEFEEIRFDGKNFYARSNSPQTLFRLIAAPGIIYEASGQEINFTIPAGKESEYRFLRLDASLAKREILYSQPFMLC